MFKNYFEKMIRKEIAYMKEIENGIHFDLNLQIKSLKKEIEKLKINNNDLMQNNIRYTNENFDLKNQIISLEKELEKCKNKDNIKANEYVWVNPPEVEKELPKIQFLNQSQIAKRFGYAESTISYWRKKGKIHFNSRNKKVIYYNVKDVEIDLKKMGKFKGKIGTD
jgi:DNA-binding transcriptional MerR regulator